MKRTMIQTGNRNYSTGKRRFLAFLLTAAAGCGLSGSMQAQTPDWQWAKSAGGASASSSSSDIAVDAEGNSYVTGYFSGGNMTHGTIVLPPADPMSTTVFLAKYSKAGAVLWAKSFEQGFNCSGNGVATDAAGNVYLVGTFTDWIKFGGTTLNSVGESDIFVAKFNAAGNLLWAKKGGGAGSDYGNDVAVDNAGNICITGSFTGSASFDTKTISSAADLSFFVTRYDNSGNALWVKGGTSTGLSGGQSIATDASKNILVAGSYMTTPITIGGTTLPFSGVDDIFIAKLDPTGNVVWAKKAGGTGTDNPGNITTDATGNVYLSGIFSNTLTLDGTTLTSSGDRDCFFAKLNPGGTTVWAKSGGGNGTELNAYVAVDKNGQVNVAGAYGFMDKTATFGTVTLDNAGEADMFMGRYDAAGTLLWMKKAGGTGQEGASALGVDNNANIYVYGTYASPTIAFGTTNISNPHVGWSSVFIAKYGTATTGIGNLPELTNWQVYPNPASGIFNIAYKGRIQEIRVTNVLGQEVFRKAGVQNNNTIDLTHQPQGLYWISVRADEGYGRQQVLLKK